MTRRELTRYMWNWNYTTQECLEGFAYCRECGVDVQQLAPWEFEDFVMVANGITY